MWNFKAVKVGLYAILFLLLFSDLFAQSKESEIFSIAEDYKVSEQTNTPTYFKFSPSQVVEDEVFFDWLFQAFDINLNYEFNLIDIQEDKIGLKHYRYQQTFNGVPIRTAHLILHLNGDNKVISFNGEFYKENLASLSKENINIDEARNKAILLVNAEKYKWEIKEEEEFIKKEQNDQTATFFPKGNLIYLNVDPSSNQNLLCFVFDIYAQEPLSRKLIYVDASNGDVVFEEDKIKHGGSSKGVANTAYSGLRSIVTDSLVNIFRLRDSTRGNGVETYDMNNSRQYSSSVDFIDSNNIWNSFSPSINQYAMDAHWATEKTYDYLDSVHNRNSIDNNGFTLKSYVHYDINYVNAFWDGQRMTYGDGDASRTPLTTIDISAHEVAHGWTDYTSDLIYANESGALNESFSDILGFLVEYYARNANWNWTIGEEIGGAFRSMSNPNSYGHPDTYGGLNWVNQNCIPTSNNDRCGVHTNSGVQNHWFYLLSQGGSGINDIGDTINVNGIGISKAADIAFRTNTVYLTPSSNYSDARFYSFRAAVDLFGACSAEVEDVINAWHAVGVGDSYKNGVSAEFLAINDTSFCRVPSQIDFKAINSSNIYSYYWDFGDGNTSIQREPSHSYTRFGSFDVKLIANGGSCGVDSIIKSNYINIDSTFICSSYLNSQTQITSNCRGTLYDNGGLNGNYSINRSDTFIINVPTADYIKVFFDSIDVEAAFKGRCNHDYIEVYDGGGESSALIDKICNNNKLDSIVSTSNKLMIVFNSDRRNNGSGVRLRWQCAQATQAPTVNFVSFPDTSCNGFVNFVEKVSYGYQQLEWDFGDGSISTIQNPTHRYQVNGVYDVTLKAINSQGADSLVKVGKVVVNRANAPLTQSDTLCVGDTAKLYANGPANLIWYSSLLGENQVHQGDSLIINSLVSSRNYFVESLISVQTITLVPFTLSGSTFYTDTAESIYFDVFEPVTIESFILRSSGFNGDRRLEIKDSTGRIIFTKSVYVSGSGSQVQIGANLYPGRNYEMTFGSRDIGLLVNQNGANYPYNTGNLMSIHSSSLGSSAYPFFYLFRIKPIPCASMRSKVTAFVDTNCTITSINDKQLNNTKFDIYPIPFENEINLTFPESESELRIFIFDSKGSLVYENNISKSESKVKLSQLKSKGIYFLKAIGTNSIYQKKLIKQ